MVRLESPSACATVALGNHAARSGRLNEKKE
jgi:hypothetical protein